MAKGKPANSWRDVAGSVAMAAVSWFATTSGTFFSQIAGWLGVVFFGGGAVVLALANFGVALPSRYAGKRVAVKPLVSAPIDVSAEQRARVDHLLAALQRFGVLDDPSIEARYLYEGAVDAAGPGHQVMVDDVLAGLGEVPYRHGDVDLSAVERTVAALAIDDHQIADDIASDITLLAALGPEPLDVSFPPMAGGDAALLRAIVDGHSLEIYDVLGDPRAPVFAHIGALAAIHERRWPGFRLAVIARGETLFIVRLADGALKECKRALGIEDHYCELGWVEHVVGPELGRASIDWR